MIRRIFKRTCEALLVYSQSNIHPRPLIADQDALTIGRHDTELQLLSCPFPASGAKPRAKRAKVSSDQETSNVQSRVESGRYTSLQAFLADIDKASSAVIERNQNQPNGTKSDGSPLTEVVNRIAAFKKHMNSLVVQSFVNQPEVKTEASEEDAEEQVPSTISSVGAREDRQALTFFGGSQSNPKQLFSSLQKPVKVPLQTFDPDEEKFVEVHEELREDALPNGISATKVIPFNLDATKAPKRTFGEVFAPRSGYQLEPPRTQSNPSKVVSWVDPFDTVFDPRAFPGDRNNYFLASLPTGQWLQYGGITSSPSFWSRVEKSHAQESTRQVHADPALWTGDDSSLLQGVYSSFAPTFDSSGAVVQSDVKDMVWWEKRGAKRLRTLLSLPYENAEQEVTSVEPGSIGDLDDATLEEMVRTFNPEDFAQPLEKEYPSKEDPELREIDEVLQEVSEMLDTLSSYQKIRNLTLSAESEKVESTETPAPDFGTPDIPSDAERAIYEHLKTTLVAIISNLPPYAIAKLNGDQLADLNVSQKILIENPDYSGTMEKDDYTLHQERAAAIAAASNATNRTSTPSASRPGSFPTPQAYNQRAFASNARISQSQPGFQIPGRQASSAGTYTPGYAGGRPSSTPSQRPGYNPQQYAHVQASPQYSHANNVPQFQRAVSNGYSAPQGQSPQPYTPRPGQPAPYNATHQGRTPYANAGSTQRHPYTNQTPSQGSYSTPAAGATYVRTAAEQAALMDRNRMQLATQQSRQSPSTPQPGFEARQPQEGSVTPGSKQNGTPVPS